MRASERQDREWESPPWPLVVGAPWVGRALRGGGAAVAPREGERHMRRKHVQAVLMGVGLAALLTGHVAMGGVANAAPQAQAQAYTGQVREVKIDQCGLEPGTCAGSLVLAQARGQAVALAIPAGTTIQRGHHRVHLEELGVGNYVTVQAAPLSPVPPGNGGDWTWGEIDAYERSPINSGAQGG
jgi:hypothetical protein